jgi:hypothetical protein
MIRTCPKCGDYYADVLLAFCLVDGTPLIDLAPDSASWIEGARAIKEKENALRKRKRKLKWQRIVMSTMAMTTLVVLVVAVNSLIYIESVSKNRPPECSGGDKDKEEKAITDKYGTEWRKNVEGNQPKIDAKDLPAGIANANVLASIATHKLITKYQSVFPKPCVASVTASYSWQITINFNGKSEVLNKSAGQQKFTCEKKGETWNCP